MYSSQLGGGLGGGRQLSEMMTTNHVMRLWKHIMVVIVAVIDSDIPYKRPFGWCV